jgi:hypothetical protein
MKKQELEKEECLMTEQEMTMSMEAEDMESTAETAMAVPIILPRLACSGVYRVTAGPSLPKYRSAEELRLDVDGRYPQMVASGYIPLSLVNRVNWIADLKPAGSNKWTGSITYKEGATGSFPYTNVAIQVTGSSPFVQRTAKVVFSGGGAAKRTRAFTYSSSYYHSVEFEFDAVQGTTAVTSMDTHAHPNRPATLPSETLTIEKVFARAGFDVKVLAPGSVPLTGAGANSRWSDAEMHDAMQAYWSRFANKAQWSMWVLFASLHDQGSSLGGVMFDDIGPQHRQGTAIFEDAFIANAPVGDPAPAAWVQRMRFWTACHEMGHSFNLAHSWQKSLIYQGNGPWIPLADEPEARSFMNYPYNVAGGQSAFFADFPFRFSDPELLFMRHAPAKFVQMGNAEWFDHHGFQQAAVSPEPRFRLEMRVNRSPARFEFLEPVVAEFKLTNISGQPQLIRQGALSNLDGLTVIIKKRGMPARQLSPYAHYCSQLQTRVVSPGESVYDSVFLSAGLNGWDIAEPGDYTVQAALHLGDEDVVSMPMQLRVSMPKTNDEQVLAQDYFGDDVGRVLAFDGTRVLHSAAMTLMEVADRLPKSRAAIHAQIPLANAKSRTYKVLDTSGQMAIEARPPDVEAAREEYSSALTERMQESAEALGHVDMKDYTTQFTDMLAENGDPQAAAAVQDQLLEVMKNRGVLPRVLDDIAARRDEYKGEKKAAAKV